MVHGHNSCPKNDPNFLAAVIFFTAIKDGMWFLYGQVELASCEPGAIWMLAFSWPAQICLFDSGRPSAMGC